MSSQRCVCLSLRKAARAVTQLYNEALRGTGCRVTQANILAIVMKRAPVPVTRLAEELVMDRTTLTRNLALLERLGYVSIANGPDRRERHISCTDEGRAVMQAVQLQWVQVQRRLSESLGMERLEGLFSELDTLLRSIQVLAATRDD